MELTDKRGEENPNILRKKNSCDHIVAWSLDQIGITVAGELNKTVENAAGMSKVINSTRDLTARPKISIGLTPSYSGRHATYASTSAKGI